MFIWKFLPSLFLLNSLFFLDALVAAERGCLSLPISSEDVFSVIVIPNKSQGASRYRLKVYSYEDQKIPTVDITHPLHGRISDVEVYDVDNDGDLELVIQSTKVVSAEKFHHDVFELVGRSLLDKVKIFLRF